MRISDWSSDVCSSDLIGAGIDLWHLFSLFFVNPGSPARVQLALAGIHDPSGLGTRAVMEIFGALGGVLLAWTWFESRPGKRRPSASERQMPDSSAQAAVIDVFTQSRPLALAAYRARSAISRAASMLSTEPGVTVCTPTQIGRAHV